LYLAGYETGAAQVGMAVVKYVKWIEGMYWDADGFGG